MPRLFVFLMFAPTIVFAVPHSQNLQKVALLYNASFESSSTSNVIEGHIRNGFQVAIDELKPARYSFQWIDVGETAETTLMAFEKIKKGMPDMIVGPSHSFQVIMLLKLLRDAKIDTPFVTPTATSTEILKFKNVLMISNSNAQQAKILAKEIGHTSAKKILVVRLKDCAYCDDFVNKFSEESIGKTAEILSIDEQEISYSEKLDQAFNVDAVLIPALESPVARIIERLYKKNQTATYWSGDGVGSLARFVRKLDLRNLRFKWITHYSPQSPGRENLEFVKKFKERSSMTPIDTSAFYFEALKFGSKRFLRHEKQSPLKTVTGDAKIVDNFVVRKMPIMELRGSELVFIKLTGMSE